MSFSDYLTPILENAWHMIKMIVTLPGMGLIMVGAISLMLAAGIFNRARRRL